MTVAGHTAVVYAKASVDAPSSGDEIDGVNKADLKLLKELLDTTDFKDTSGAHTRIAGLKDCEINIAGDLEMADAPQDALRTAYDDGSSIWITVHFAPSGASGSKGYQVETLVESESPAVSFDGKGECSWTLKATGAVTRV